MAETVKVAIFAEGQTEQIFICEAIRQLASDKNFYIVSERKNGSGARLIKMDAGKIGDQENHQIYFQILICDSDAQVLSTLREEYDTLVAAGFSHIIGVRDLFPAPIEDAGKINGIIRKYLPQGLVQPLMVLAILETEAWFIAENSHFPRIHPSLTVDAILAGTGVDVSASSELITHPYVALRSIYGLAGKEYNKSKAVVSDTVGALDIVQFLGLAGERAPSVRPLVERLQYIFS